MMFRVGENLRKLESSHILTGMVKDSLQFSEKFKISVPPNLEIPAPEILPGNWENKIWRGSSLAKSPGCFCRGPGFSSLHVHGGSQPFVT